MTALTINVDQVMHLISDLSDAARAYAVAVHEYANDRADYAPIPALTQKLAEADMALLAAFTTPAVPAPRGVTGKHREDFLALTAHQREVYRYHYNVCGRLAAHCYLIATGRMARPECRACRDARTKAAAVSL